MTGSATDDEFDVVIVGAGILGCAIALELSRRGHRTLNLDKASTAGAGSTSSSSAVIRFSYSTAAGVEMSWEGVQYWKQWADHVGPHDELGLAQYRQCGLVVFTSEGHTFSAQVAQLWHDLGIPHEVWDHDELARRLPFLDLGLYGPPTDQDDPAFWRDATGAFTGALYAPDAGYVSDPQLAAHNLARAAEHAGASFLFNVAVVDVCRRDGAVTGVTLADGRHVAAKVVVNAAGPHSAHVNRMADVYEAMNIKTAPLRQEVHHAPAPAGFDADGHAVLAADDDLGFYFRPDIGGNIVIGSIDPDCDPREYVDADEFNPNVTDERWQLQLLRANRRMPSLGVPHRKRGVVGCYDASDDWLPIFDRTDLDGFYVAIGSSGNLFKNVGVVGQVMADLIEAVEAGHDHDASPLQVTGRHTGCVIDLGLYGRNRPLSIASTMSVLG